MSEEVRQSIREFRDRVCRLYEDRLRALVLYGSHARGDADEGSDVDLLLVLDNFEDADAEYARISPIASEISLKYDVVISCLLYREDEYLRWNTPLLLNVRREGVQV